MNESRFPRRDWQLNQRQLGKMRSCSMFGCLWRVSWAKEKRFEGLQFEGKIPPIRKNAFEEGQGKERRENGSFGFHSLSSVQRVNQPANFRHQRAQGKKAHLHEKKT